MAARRPDRPGRGVRPGARPDRPDRGLQLGRRRGRRCLSVRPSSAATRAGAFVTTPVAGRRRPRPAAGRPRPGSGRPRCSSWSAATLGDRNEALGPLTVLLAVLGLVAGDRLASLAGWLLAGAALRPVERMRSEAAAISVSELDRRLPVPPADDELRRLGATLNELLARLEEAVRAEGALPRPGEPRAADAARRAEDGAGPRSVRAVVVPRGDRAALESGFRRGRPAGPPRRGPAGAGTGPPWAAPRAPHADGRRGSGRIRLSSPRREGAGRGHHARVRRSGMPGVGRSLADPSGARRPGRQRSQACRIERSCLRPGRGRRACRRGGGRRPRLPAGHPGRDRRRSGRRMQQPHRSAAGLASRSRARSRRRMAERSSSSTRHPGERSPGSSFVLSRRTPCERRRALIARATARSRLPLRRAGTGASGRDALQLVLAGVLEHEPGPDDQVLHGRGDPDLRGPAFAPIRAPIATAMPPDFPSIVSTSPVWTPARTSIPSGRTASTIARAHRTARAGPSNVAKNRRRRCRPPRLGSGRGANGPSRDGVRPGPATRGRRARRPSRSSPRCR